MANTLREMIQGVLALQPMWVKENTPQMQKRGQLIRKQIPAKLQGLAQAHGFKAEGSDGSGKKTRVPWVRIYDDQLSPSAMVGWYVVMLFSVDGARVYISLNQGTTKFANNTLVKLDTALLESRKQQAVSIIKNSGLDTVQFVQTITLADIKGGIGEGYEEGNLCAVMYETQQMPDDTQIMADWERLLTLLKPLYAIETKKPLNSYLLSWNPDKWQWDGLAELAAKVKSGIGVEPTPWNVANKTVWPGDRVFLVRLGKEPKGLVASGHVVRAPYQRQHYSGKQGKTATYIDIEWDALIDPNVEPVLSLDVLQTKIAGVHWTPQNSGILITQESIGTLEALWASHLAANTYTLDDGIADVFIDAAEFKGLYNLVRQRKNVILQGPPGVGKTFIAKRLAWVLAAQKKTPCIGWVQFHQSYSYEDFVEGFRPANAGFKLMDGVFYEFCQRAAAATSDQPFVFVIDEINRGNLSKIFGEVLSLIEADKRDVHHVRLAYASAADDPQRKKMSEEFAVPKNVHLIGLMNTADRSLAVVDYALRRRFAFADLTPCFDRPKFDEFLNQKGISPELREQIKTRLKRLNEIIVSDSRSLGKGFEIGHSFFCPSQTIIDEQDWYRGIVQHDLKPLLREYWFDDKDKADREIEALLNENTD